jgi:(p)ppGpp synthase/HD superfamily hydrolase
MLGKAIAIASTVHACQKDKGGNAYILHPIRIMMRLRTQDDELMQIAILHDVVEDSNDWSIEKLKAEGFSDRVVSALELLTHAPDEPYDAYIKRIATNRDATKIKLEDLRDNSDITRLKGLRQKDFERMEKYHRAFLFLQKTLDAMETCGY